MKMTKMTTNEAVEGEDMMKGNGFNDMNLGGTPPGMTLKTTQVLPKDLTEWVGSIALVRVTLEAVVKTQALARGDGLKQTFGGCRPQMLLTLLTYAYARNILGSRDIETAIPESKPLKYICAGDRPDWNLLRRFRRQYKALVQACLAEVLQSVWSQQYPASPAVADFSYAATSLDRWLNPQTPDFATEAAKRVRLAIQMDTLMSDE